MHREDQPFNRFRKVDPAEGSISQAAGFRNILIVESPGEELSPDQGSVTKTMARPEAKFRT